MRTARLLSFLPGIHKLVRDHRRLGEEVGRLKEELAAIRQEKARCQPEGSGADPVAGQPPLPGFHPRPPSYVLSNTLGAAYLQIPKAACSSILARILAAEKPDAYAQLEATLRQSVAPLHHAEGLFSKSRSADGLLRFTFVRHPFDRVHSFYQSQVNSSHCEPGFGDQRSLAEELERTGFRLGMPLEEYVTRILGDPVARNNHHVRPQSEFVLGPQGLNVDFIGKIEEMEWHWARLDAALGGKLGKIDRLNFAGGQSWRTSSHFDGRTVALLAGHYRHDLWLFGYGTADRD
jgi:hypothetical protein